MNTNTTIVLIVKNTVALKKNISVRRRNMKTFINRLRWFNIGALLGMGFILWLVDYTSDVKKDSNPGKLLGDYEKATSFDDVYNHYVAKEKINNA